MKLSNKKHGRKRKGFKAIFPVCLLMILAVSLTIGGTLAFLKEDTIGVSNTFKAGDITYTLNLDANAKNANPKYTNDKVDMPEDLNAQTKTDQSVTFEANKTPELEGYIFKGWYYDADCTEGMMHTPDPGTSITVSYDDTHDSNEDANKVEITLYANWKPIKYLIAYEGNEATEGVMVPHPYTYDAPLPLEPNAYIRTGYTFKEWNTVVDGTGTSYANEETVENLTNVNDATVTLHAQWEANKYTVKFYANNGTGTMADQDFTYDEPQNLNENQFNRTGYEFLGWSPNRDTTVATYTDEQEVSNLTSAPDGVVELYAVWKANEYTIRYDDNGGDGEMADTKAVYDQKVTLSENAFTKDGYTFNGWNTKADGSGDSYEDKATVKNLTTEKGKIVTLYAQWEANEYVVNFDANGGTGSMDDQTFTYDKEKNLKANEFERIGYTFDGWNTAADGSGTAYADEATVKNLATDGTVTLYAQWKPITYTVVYNANAEEGITGSTEESIHTYDVEKNLTANGFVRTGYTFIGWNTKEDGTGTLYTDKQSVVNLTADKNGVVTLYAQWGAKSYVLRFHANGGEGAMADQTIKYDEPTALNANQFIKNDHSFMGWALTADGEKEYNDMETVVNLLESGILDLYAVWAQDTHTVKFDYNGGSGSVASMPFQNGKAYGELPKYPVHPTEDMGNNKVMTYLFTGWYTAPTGGERVYPSTIANRTDDHTLYAHWEEAPSNNVIKEIVVKNNPDDDNDGVVDDVYLNLKCSSSFEKFNIPLKNLLIGQKYKLTYTASNDASFGDYFEGYRNSVYGSYIVETSELTSGLIKDYVGKQILANWDNREEPDGTNDGSHAATNDEYLKGPWKNRTITFTATKDTMYWVWDFGLMQDNILNNYNMTDIKLEPVEPNIEFANKNLILYTTSNAQVLNDNSSKYASNFVFDGDGYAETMYFPITGLNKGSTYTVVFDHKISGALINSSSYDYGCGISSIKPTKYGSYMKDLGATWISTTQPVFTNLDTMESVTLTFTATDSTAYFVWNMANCSDNNNCTIDVKVTEFSASHKNGSITYYTAASNAGITLDLMPEVVNEITFLYDGIDLTNMDNLLPVDEDFPVAGDSYELAFEPAEGCTMAEIITVVIDDVTYEVYTNGQTEEGIIAPVYDPESNVLTIPAELLTDETSTVAINASAVPVENIIPIEPEEEMVPPETETVPGGGGAGETPETTLDAVIPNEDEEEATPEPGTDVAPPSNKPEDETDEDEGTEPNEGEGTEPGEGEGTESNEGEGTEPNEGEGTEPGAGTTPDGTDSTEEPTPDNGDAVLPSKPEDETDEDTTPGEGENTTPGEGEDTTPGEGENTTPGEGEDTTSGEGEDTTSGEGEDTTSGEGEDTTPGEGEDTTSGEGEDTTSDAAESGSTDVGSGDSDSESESDNGEGEDNSDDGNASNGGSSTDSGSAGGSEATAPSNKEDDGPEVTA